MDAIVVPGLVLREKAQKIAVVVIQGTKSGGFFRLGKITPVFRSLCLAFVFRQHFGAGMGDNTLNNTCMAVILSQVPRKPDIALFPRWPYRNIFSDFVLIAMLV